MNNKPSFTDHPDAKCFAQDPDGSWWKNTITKDITPNNGCWKNSAVGYRGFRKVSEGEVIGDWKDSLMLPHDNAKPPLGLRPRKVVDHLRKLEILEAMTRYVTEDKLVPTEWLDELMELLS